VPSPKTMDNDSVFSLSDAKFLRPEDIAVIEEALQKVGPFGEVHLVVENGRLRYLRTLRSESLDHADQSKAHAKNRT
jgi:hypothetical protein